MNHTFKKENGHLKANVSFGADEIKKANEKAVTKLSQQVTVPGFRKGAAPVDMASRYLRNDDVAEEIINQLLRSIDREFAKLDDFNAYVKSNQLLESFRPNVSVTKFSNTEAEIAIVYVLRPEVTKLGEYKGLKSSAAKKEVTDKDVDAEIKKLAENEAELTPKEKVSEKGDTVNIDFTGLMDGKEFEGGSSKSFDLELGSGHFVPGFEDQCIGHKAGDKFDVALTMPANYPEPLTNKAVVFKVVLNAVKVKDVPEINDAFATTLSGANASKDLAELKTKVKANLVKDSETAYDSALVNDLLLQVRDHSEFVIAKEYLDQVTEDRVKEDEKRITEQGLTLPEYLKLIGKAEEDYRKEITAGVESELKSSLVYNALAEAEKIPSPTQADIEKRLNSNIPDFVKNFTSYLKAQKLPDDQIQEEINNYLNQIFASMMSQRVQDRLLILNGYKQPEPEAKPAEAKPAEVKPAEAKKADDKPAEAAAPSEKPAETK
ncbi:MAG: trigger factor [Bacilli bacterium]|jgi:trigger factor|nr:trigger factor [Bacilli bacterium]